MPQLPLHEPAPDLRQRALALWRRVGGLGLIGVGLALVLATAVLVQERQLALVERARQSGDGLSVLSLYQLEIEYLRLQQQWRLAVAEPALPLDELKLRYDAWISRIGLTQSGTLRSLLGRDPAFNQTTAELEAFVHAADRQIGPQRSDPPDRATLAALLGPLDALAQPIHALALTGAQRLAERTDVGSQALQQQARLGIALSACLGALCLAFGLLAMRQMRQLQKRREALEDLTARLRDAQRDAEAANAAKSAFLANMSHEIRTPFQGLLGMLALLRESPMSPQQAEQLRSATESADHLLAILNDILDLSMLESGKLMLHPAPLSVPAMLRQIEALMRPQAARRSITLHVDVEPAVPEWIQADATRVKQILFNLMSNAIKFTPRGSISLEVRVGDGTPALLRFVVTDTGIGMDRETVSHLFSRFSAGAIDLTRRHAGAGLGLEISRNLARMMGGDIHVHSVPGEGSRFSFELPLHRLPGAPPPPAPMLDPGTATRALHVLVAEDHPVSRQYLASLLEMLQHRAHFVGNGRDAVLAVQQQRFDLVLMDLHMPELDGIGATLAIRALPDASAATLPIVALTADAFQDTRERCLLAGMNDFLTKPVSPQDLAGALRRLYGQGAAESVAPATGLPVTAPPTRPAASLIDRPAIDKILTGLSADRLACLIEECLVQGRQSAEQMRAAVRDGQPLELRGHAHAARGAALNLGLAALAQTAQALHEGAAHLPAHEVAHLLQRFEDLLPRTRQAAMEAGLLGESLPAKG